MIIIAACIMKIHFIYFPCKNPAEVEADNFSNIDEISSLISQVVFPLK